MRLPFLQLESDIISHGAAEVSHLARCSIPQALGHIAMVRAWAVSHATDEAPPDGWVPGDASGRRIEAAAHWQGENGALLQALIDAGHVRVEEGGHRVLRLEPYAKAWEQNRKSKERMRNARERSSNKPVMDANNGIESGERSAKFDGQTQTQTQTQKEEASASQASAAAPPPVLVVQEAAPEKPKRAPSTTAMGEFIDWARAEVKPRLPPDALDPAAGMKPHERVRLGEAVKDHGLESVKAAFRLFMGWAVAESKGYSVGFFANQWETWVRQAKAAVAPAGRPNAVGRGAEGPARECAGCGEETGEGQQHGQTWVGLYCGCGAALFRLATPPADVGQWARNRRAGRAA